MAKKVKLSLPILAALPPEMLRNVLEYDLHIATNRYAESRGWKCFYIHRTGMMGADGKWKGMAPAGWPDSVYVRDGRMVCAEFKSMKGKPTKEQESWLNELAAIPGVVTYVWTPAAASVAMEVLK